MSRTKLNEKNHAVIKKLLGEQVPLYMIARKLKVERHTLSNYIQKHDELKDAVVDASESFHDSVEYMLKQRILKGKDLHAAMWYADRKLRSRGYGEHIETDVNATLGGRVVIKIGKISEDEVPSPQKKD